MQPLGARPIAKRLNSYQRARAHCVGAFAECSSDIHVLLRETVKFAAMHNWRKVGATYPESALATYAAIYRHRWGAELALQGFASGSQGRIWPSQHNHAQPIEPKITSAELDPSDSGWYAAEAAPILGGAHEGQDRYQC